MLWFSHIISGMSENQPRKPGTPGGQRTGPADVSTATYWRRRFFVLAASVGVVAVVAWAVNGMLSVPSTPSQAASSPHATATGSAPVSLSNVLPTPTPSPSPAASRSAPSRHAGKKSRHDGKNVAGAAGRPRACAPASVTLRLSSPQYWYQAGISPRFTVRAASGAGNPCRFNVGTKFVSVVIAAGSRHIWSSSDCASGDVSSAVVLAPGKPAVLHTSWNRKSSSPGCGASHLVRPGEYRVTAIAGRVHSKAVNVVLGAKGAHGP
jgi:hypothetical protein